RGDARGYAHLGLPMFEGLGIDRGGVAEDPQHEARTLLAGRVSVVHGVVDHRPDDAGRDLLREPGAHSFTHHRTATSRPEFSSRKARSSVSASEASPAVTSRPPASW